MANTVNSDLYLNSTQNTSNTTRETGSTLGKDDFLKLLMTQLENQDPTNPMDDTQFIAQMAQFSSLEQMTNMTDQMQKLQQITYSQFVGKDVSWQKSTDSDASSTTNQSASGTGKISSVSFNDDGSVSFTLQDGTVLSSDDISKITDDSTSNSTLVQASYLIGKHITWQNDNNEDESATVTAVSVKDGSSLLTLDNGDTITSDQILKISQ
ncbi:flagellar hook assembly protein FlgD [Heyndrickxia ginsengihumi]|uniref:flagellar hook assembly protein FlgD n=1 Tax=Heyndrickxia ginsengihumi TaxID=363870 RepID=UPI0004704FC9|nr:flagellar hook assembly protein FlgD [Heyndrickxia ginsengihumi]MCM3022497.1 flagellar hook assembly protein FlgD [Heyndrickxia ginsengihumi]